MQKFPEVCLGSKRHFLKECKDFNILLQNKVLKYFKKNEKIDMREGVHKPHQKKLTALPGDLHRPPVAGSSLVEDHSLNLEKPSDFLSLPLL